MSGVAQGGALPAAVLPGFGGLAPGAGALAAAAPDGAPVPAWGSFAGWLAQAAAGPASGPDAEATPGAAPWAATALNVAAAALGPHGPASVAATPAPTTVAPAPALRPGDAVAWFQGPADGALDAWPDAWSRPGDDVGKGSPEMPWTHDADRLPLALRTGALVPLKAMQGLQRLEQALMQAEALQAASLAVGELALTTTDPAPAAMTALTASFGLQDGDAQAPPQELGAAVPDAAAAWALPWTAPPASSVGAPPSPPGEAIAVTSEAPVAGRATASARAMSEASAVDAVVPAAGTTAPAAATAPEATNGSATKTAPAVPAAIASAASYVVAEPDTAAPVDSIETPAATGAGDALDGAAVEARAPTRSSRGDPAHGGARAALRRDLEAVDPAHAAGAAEGAGAPGVEGDGEPGGARRSRAAGTGTALHATAVLQQAATAAATPAGGGAGDSPAVSSADRSVVNATPSAGEASTGGRDTAPSHTALTHGAVPAAAARTADGARFAQELAATFEARLSTPVQSPQFGGALGLQISTLVRHGISEARLQLNPAELGPIAVQIALDGTATQVHLAADHVLTRQALEQALPQLASALSDAGFTLAGGGVSQQSASEQSASGDGRREASAPGGARPGATSADVADAPASPQPLRRALPGQVDFYA